MSPRLKEAYWARDSASQLMEAHTHTQSQLWLYMCVLRLKSQGDPNTGRTRTLMTKLPWKCLTTGVVMLGTGILHIIVLLSSTALSCVNCGICHLIAFWERKRSYRKTQTVYLDSCSFHMILHLDFCSLKCENGTCCCLHPLFHYHFGKDTLTRNVNCNVLSLC